MQADVHEELRLVAAGAQLEVPGGEAAAERYEVSHFRGPELIRLGFFFLQSIPGRKTNHEKREECAGFR